MIQIITLSGQPAALVIDAQATIPSRLVGSELAHVQAKALYAIQIHAAAPGGPAAV